VACGCTRIARTGLRGGSPLNQTVCCRGDSVADLGARVRGATMTGRSQHLSALAIAILGIVLLMLPVHANATSFITIDDTLPNDQVSVSWAGGFAGAFTGFSLSSNCTMTAGSTANSGSGTCSETSPIVLTVDGVGHLAGGTSG